MFNEGNLKYPFRKISKSEINPNFSFKNMPYNPNDGYIRPYSLIPGKFFDSIVTITYPGVKENMYLITSTGIVFNANTSVMLTSYVKPNGYYVIKLQTNDGGRVFLLHRLVAYQFCNPPENFRNFIVNHVDSKKYNNFANNLEWITSAANNQHAIESHTTDDIFVTNGRPVVSEDFIRLLCREFAEGKSNTEIMKHLGMEINNANHTLLRDIRSGNTWTSITSQYLFDRNSKKHAYNKEEKEIIFEYISQGKTDAEIFFLMNGREYVPSTDRLDPKYRTIYSIRTSFALKQAKKGWS